MRLPKIKRPDLGSILQVKKQRLKEKPNVHCLHCDYIWYDASYEKNKKLPLFCIRCYKREIEPNPSFIQALIRRIKKEQARRKRAARRRIGRGKLR